MNNNRSISVGGSVSGAVLTTGDHNTVTLTTTTLPPAAEVDIAEVLTRLHQLMASAATPAQPRIELELSDAKAEAAKPEPNKADIAGALERAVKAFKATDAFASKANELTGLVSKAADWIGGVDASGLLALVGLKG